MKKNFFKNVIISWKNTCCTRSLRKEHSVKKEGEKKKKLDVQIEDE